MKNNKITSVNPVRIELKELNEIIKIAEYGYCPYNVENFTFSQAQLVLCIHALTEYFKKLNIALPIDLQVLKYQDNMDIDDDTDWDNELKTNKFNVGGRRGKR